MPGFLMITLEATLGRSKPSLATMKELRKRLSDRPERKRRGMTTLPFRGANAECKRREISLCAGRRIRRSKCGRKSRLAPFEMTGGVGGGRRSAGCIGSGKIRGEATAAKEGG